MTVRTLVTSPRTLASWSPHEDDSTTMVAFILDLPSDWDWSESSVEVVTPVMNQGQCGSSLAFSMTGALAGVLAVGNGWTQTIFEQQILDCNT